MIRKLNIRCEGQFLQRWVIGCFAFIVSFGWMPQAVAQTITPSVSQAFSAETKRPSFTVGSKRFTESYILGELIALVANQTQEANVFLRPGLGNTGILIAALKSGEIDIYPEYMGTILREILQSKLPLDAEALRQKLASMGLAASMPLGFNNTYALAMREEQARALNIETISDLKNHPTLKLGLTQEFIGRQDGWLGLKKTYDLPQQSPRGIDHGLIYGAIAAKQVDVMDAYTTDARLLNEPIRILKDDLGYFPSYEAVLLYRADLPERLPKIWTALGSLTQSIDAVAMINLNSRAEKNKIPVAQVARDFLETQGQHAADIQAPHTFDKQSVFDAFKNFIALMFGNDFWQLTKQHSMLVLVSLGLSVLIGIPLGILAYRVPRVRQVVLGLISVLNTIPSLALFALLIPILGMIGVVPAIFALALYGLLPIVRNTYSGLTDISSEIKESTVMLGLGQRFCLFRIELPMATRSILSGIKTSAIINVGSATIAAFIGAGGYGERIVQGLALNDNAMLLAGAIPAAVLALLVHGLFEYLENKLVPAGLKIR